MLDALPDFWTVDVDTSSHDSVMAGVVSQRVSRVHLSRQDFPDPLDAGLAAAQLAVAVHGGMPTRIRHCL